MEIEANEIQIRDFPTVGKILVLICDNEIQMGLLHQLIGEKGNYEVRVYKGKLNDNISIGLTIKKIGAVMKINSSKNANNYPPIKWLFSGQVKYLAVGYLDPHTRELIHTPPMPLNGLIQPSQYN
jgi:hypothetical protein